MESENQENKVKIVNRWNGSVVFKDKSKSMIETVENAVAARASLSGADLRDANLRDAKNICPTIFLLAHWYVSDALVVELMRYDAANHPNPRAFDLWAKGGPCPYDGVQISRVANFNQRSSLWSLGPAKSAYELMVMVMAECCKRDDTKCEVIPDAPTTDSA